MTATDDQTPGTIVTDQFDWTSAVHALVAAFEHEIGLAAGQSRPFGGRRQGTRGASDGTEGVQWNTWLHATGEAWCGVNLEGLVYDDWPIARVIERERQQPRLLEVRERVPRPDVVEVVWYRDAWQASSRPPIDEKHMAGSPSPLTAMTVEDWRTALREAYACLDASKGHRGRGRRMVTLTKNRQRLHMEVSPHLQFRQRLHPAGAGGWRDTLRDARQNLQPLHDWLTELASA